MMAQQRDMSIVIVGHVDHGKSTILGRLLADTGSLPEGKLDQVRERCRRNSKPFEYAFLLDALKEEQAQGITIDVARCFFATEKRKYLIIDAPGHIEFLKNMVTGASRAEAALLVIDAAEGIQENSRRHGYLLSLLGITQVAVLVNKMDLVQYHQEVFQKIQAEYTHFLEQIGVTPRAFIPVSGMEGDGVAALSEAMPWYTGNTVLEQLDAFVSEPAPKNRPFRMPLQGVYKFTRGGDDRRIAAGSILSGKIALGDEVVFYPSGKKSQVKSLERFSGEPPLSAAAGEAAGFTLEEQIFLRRGEVATLAREPKPSVARRFRASVFWLGRNPLTREKSYFLKAGTAKVEARLAEVLQVIDASTLEQQNKNCLERHDVGECVFEAQAPFAFDLAEEMAETSRFVLVDAFEIAGGGIIREALEDADTWLRNKLLVRNRKWEHSLVSPEERADLYNQHPELVIITGATGEERKSVAKALEKHLLHRGKKAYFLGMGNLLYGVDADLKKEGNGAAAFQDRKEHMRRLGEVAHLLLDAGLIAIVTARDLEEQDVAILRKAIAPSERNGITCLLGETSSSPNLRFDLRLERGEQPEELAKSLARHLGERGVFFAP